jgi:hypothetical protein
MCQGRSGSHSFSHRFERGTALSLMRPAKKNKIDGKVPVSPSVTNGGGGRVNRSRCELENELETLELENAGNAGASNELKTLELETCSNGYMLR